MTSRERVRAAMARQIPDRVPINYMSNPGIHARLLQHFGLAADDSAGLKRCLGVDFGGVGAPYIGPRLHPEIPGRQVDPASGIRRMYIEHEDGGYWDFCDFPLKDAAFEVIENWPMPSPDHYDYNRVSLRCSQMGDLAVYVGNPGLADIMNSSGMIMGVEQTMMDIVDPDSPLQRYTDRRLGLQLAVLQRTLEAAGGRIDFLWMGEDLGTQRGPIISMETYRRFLRPRHQKFVDLARSYNLPVMIHCCGSSSWAFDEFVQMGINVVDTLQPEAKDMSPAYLKQRFGDRLAFHGCISTAGPVAYGSVEDVRQNVRQTLEIMMPGGGYCLAPTHCLQDNSPTENVVAMYETARQYGQY